jgi:hypothetical protein
MLCLQLLEKTLGEGDSLGFLFGFGRISAVRFLYCLNFCRYSWGKDTSSSASGAFCMSIIA